MTLVATYHSVNTEEEGGSTKELRKRLPLIITHTVHVIGTYWNTLKTLIWCADSWIYVHSLQTINREVHSRGACNVRGRSRLCEEEQRILIVN